MRAIWSGSISFGLVNIPVNLYSASEERALSFRMLDKKDLCPISYVKVCREDHKVVDQKDLVKGYEYKKGKFVILEDEDFKRAAAKDTDRIDIMSFTKVSDIPVVLYDKPYFLEPEKEAAKAYTLLRQALERSGKAGICRYIMRDREHIGAIFPHGKGMILEQLRFEDELRKPQGLAFPRAAGYSRKELELALSLVKNLSGKFDPGKYKDTYADKLRKIIAAKAKGRLKKLPEPEETPEPSTAPDILAMLKRSLERAPARRG